ncbi:MAG: sigma-70 family RNA polymerase sigma factor [Verrucomicrobia bacterium]|jgi:DNA-directed RNA polymerase specialized sigma24 family protein|nr:sigma-70 family RNA polymerase sigma factor [Verrucomicrobiota bacterium]MDA7667377.1 sigma-70 family RNA polymerase sigma factor [bacterium]
MQDAAFPREFNTTHWSLVLAAKPDASDPGAARKALESLCKAYWYPLYAFVRQQGFSSSDSQDLTQSFFATFIEKEGFAPADPKRGRFRSYLLGSLKNFLNHDRERRHAKKRGGGVPIIELDALDPEARYVLEPAQSWDPEARFNREWAQEVNSRALRKLKSESERSGKGQHFEVLKESLTGIEPDRVKMARRLNLSDGALKVAVHRIRKRYREWLRAEIAETVADQAEVQDEMRCLVAALIKNMDVSV